MTQITERPPHTTVSSAVPVPSLLEGCSSLIKRMRTVDAEGGAELLDQLALLIMDPDADKAAMIALFYRNNSNGVDTLGTLFYGASEDDGNGPVVAPSTSRVMNRNYRDALNRLHAALKSVIPSDDATLDVKRDFWEDVKTHVPAGDAVDHGQVADVTIADLRTVLKSLYGVSVKRNLTAYTDADSSLNFVLFNPATTEGTKLEIRSSLRLNGEEPPSGCISLRTMNGVVHFV